MEEKSLSDAEKIKHDLKHELEHMNIQHATLEIESSDENCEEDHRSL